MFEVAPVSLWLEDYSGVRRQLEEWRGRGISDLRAFLAADLTRVHHCTRLIKVVRVNRKTLSFSSSTSEIDATRCHAIVSEPK